MRATRILTVTLLAAAIMLLPVGCSSAGQLRAGQLRKYCEATGAEAPSRIGGSAAPTGDPRADGAAANTDGSGTAATNASGG